MIRTAAAVMLCSLVLAGCQTTQATSTLATPSGQALKVNSYFSLNADCTSVGPTNIRVTRAPANGQITVRQNLQYPSYARVNDRHHCNRRRVPSTSVYYTPKPGFTGEDSFDIESIFATGRLSTRTFRMIVR
jgi:hypothetical protein